MSLKVTLIGPHPHNVGGISMHMKRLTYLLSDECEFDFVDEGHTRFEHVFNIRSCNFIRYLSIIRSSDVVHINSGHYLLRLFHMIVCKMLLRKHTVVTVHRNPEVEPCLGLTRFLMKKCDHVIVVNQEGYNLLAGSNPGRRFLMQPAFLPPVIDNEPTLPEPVLHWLQVAQSQPNHYIMVSNAWNLVMHHGEDLYGLDLCIQAAIKLCKQQDNKQYFFVFVVATCTENTDLLHRYQKQIKDCGLEDVFLIWTSPLSFVRLIAFSDVLLRTTNTDGDAISIREALFMGKKVIASDVVKRPEGVVLFKNRNADSLVEAIELSENYESSPTTEGSFDYKHFYLKLYLSNNEATNTETS